MVGGRVWEENNWMVTFTINFVQENDLNLHFKNNYEDNTK